MALCWSGKSSSNTVKSSPGVRRTGTFVAVPTVEQVEEIVITEYSMDPKKRYKASLWIHAAIVALAAGTVFFLVAFLTCGWGRVHVMARKGSTTDVWHFGLWLCCRESDGLCVGPRWPVYYSCARSFAVLGLFGHMLSLSWLIGYAIEQLLEYDPCGLTSFIILTFATGSLGLAQLSVFGTFWAEDMRDHEFESQVFRGIAPSLDYSFYLTMIDFALVVFAGICQVVEMTIIIHRLALEERDLSGHRKQEESIIVRRRSNRQSYQYDMADRDMQIPLDEVRYTEGAVSGEYHRTSHDGAYGACGGTLDVDKIHHLHPDSAEGSQRDIYAQQSHSQGGLSRQSSDTPGSSRYSSDASSMHRHHSDSPTLSGKDIHQTDSPRSRDRDKTDSPGGSRHHIDSPRGRDNTDCTGRNLLQTDTPGSSEINPTDSPGGRERYPSGSPGGRERYPSGSPGTRDRFLTYESRDGDIAL